MTTAGHIFSIAGGTQSIPGCTVSESLLPGGSPTVFSLAAGTDISAELYPFYKLVTAAKGTVTVLLDGQRIPLPAGSSIVTPLGVPVGTKADADAVYHEISLRRNSFMNNAVTIGNVFSLKDLIPYQSGKIVNMDVAHNETMKLALMAFDAGTGLDEHAAPGDAIIFALDGEGIIRYEGQDHPIKAGENFRFAKGGLHAVKAEKPFKMALLLVLA